MSPVDVLNGWGAVWSAYMTRALIDASALLALLLLIWLPLRNRISAQLGHGLFLLVLVKLIIPTPLPTFPLVAVRQATVWVRDLSAEVIVEPPAPLADRAVEPLVLPTTGDLTAGPSDPPAPAPRSGTIAELGGTPGEPAIKPPAIARPRLSWSAVLMIGWACLATWMLARFVRTLATTRRLINRAEPLRPEWLPVDVAALCRTAGVNIPVNWAVSPLLQSPAVGGLVQPTVLIPPDLGEGLTPRQLTWVLLHELAHVRRGDLWVVFVQRIVQAVFFFHPAVHVANWIIDQLREYACDDVALAASKVSRHDCGEGFLTVVSRTVDRSAAASPALGLFESRMLIRRRLLRIIDNRRTVHERLSPRATFALAAVALAVLFPFGKMRNAAARTSTSTIALASRAGAGAGKGLDLGEPATYRPVEGWKRESSTEPGRRVTVLALAYSLDGATIATAGEDGVLILRDAKTGQVTSRLEGHRDAVCCLAFSTDGLTLASAGYDRVVRLWDLSTRREKGVLAGHSNGVFALAFSPDGKRLASAGHDRTVRLWDPKVLRETAVLKGHSGSIRALAFAPDGGCLASGGADRNVILWEPASGKLVARLEGHKGTIRGVAFAPDGLSLASAGEDSETKLWDLASRRERATFSGHSDMVTCLAFTPRGGTLATGSLDATVKLWNPGTGVERATLQAQGDGISAIAFAPVGSGLATAGFDGSVRVWEPAAPVFSPAACLDYPGKPLALAFERSGRALVVDGTAGLTRWDPRDGSVLSAPDARDAKALAVAPDRLVRREGGERNAVSPDGRWIASAQRNGDVAICDASDGRQLGLMKGHCGAVLDLAFAPDGRSLATAGEDGTVKLWNLAVARQTGRATLKGDLNDVRSVAYSRDGKSLAVADGPPNAPGNIVIWDLASRRVKATLEGHDRGVGSVVFSPDGKILASGGWDGTIRLWDAADGSPRDVLTGPTRVTQLAFSPDGKTIAAAGGEKVVTLWDVESGQESAPINGFRWPVQSLVFSPDGVQLATGGGAVRTTTGAEGEVKVWDLATRALAASFDGHTLAVLSLAFTTDGSSLASGGLDETVRVWDLASASASGSKRPHPRLTLSGLTACVQSLAFSKDGRLLSWGGRGDGLVSLHDAISGAEKVRLVGHRSAVRSVAFSPDGKSLATGGCDRTVRLWDIP